MAHECADNFADSRKEAEIRVGSDDIEFVGNDEYGNEGVVPFDEG